MDRGRPLQRIRDMHRRRRTDRDRGSSAHLTPIAAAALVVLAFGSGCGQTADSPPATAATIHATLPAGWQPIRGPVNEVTEPAQVLAVASVPLRLPERSAHGCSTAGLRLRLPPSAVAVQLVGATMGSSGDASHPNPRKYPPRPEPFRLDRRSYDTYDCYGPSYNIAFRDHGRAFQAFVWLDPRHVDPAVRAQTVALLSSIRVSRSPRPG